MNKMKNCAECHDRCPIRDVQKFTYMGYVCNDCIGITDLKTENRRLKNILRKQKAQAQKNKSKMGRRKALQRWKKWKEAKKVRNNAEEDVESDATSTQNGLEQDERV